MLRPKEAYGNKAILKLFPKPDYSHISDNIVVSDANWIPFDKIFIDDEEGNVARADGQDPAHIEDLKSSFSAGVLINEELGAVVKQPEGSPKPYKLTYGFGRTLALIELGVKGWAFNIIEGTQTEIEDVQSFENEPKAPKRTNQEKDIIRLKSRQVKEGRLDNNEDVIMEHLKKTYPRRKKPSLERIAAGIYEDNNTPVKYAYYTDAKIKLWRENHSKDWFEIGGKWDNKKQEHGFTTHNGGLYRTMYRAAMKYASDGTTSYVNCFTGTVSKGSTLEDQRQSCIDEYVRLRVNYAIVYGTNPCFLRLNGFFPQAWGKDKWKEFIKIDMKKIEKRIAKEIKLRNAGTPVDPLQEKVNVKLAKAI